jgi:hypothetical protein
MFCPTKELMRNVVHVFKYLAGTLDLALLFEKKGDAIRFFSADFAGDRRAGVPLDTLACYLGRVYPDRVV